MKIHEGWVFYGADFSAKSNGAVNYGEVSLTRSLEQKRLRYKDLWPINHRDRLTGDFVTGEGETFEAALADANAKAKEKG